MFKELNLKNWWFIWGLLWHLSSPRSEYRQSQIWFLWLKLLGLLGSLEKQWFWYTAKSTRACEEKMNPIITVTEAPHRVVKPLNSPLSFYGILSARMGKWHFIHRSPLYCNCCPLSWPSALTKLLNSRTSHEECSAVPARCWTGTQPCNAK